MLIPATTTLRVEDFPEQRSWIDKLLSPMNQAFTGIINSVNGQLDFGTNFPAQTKTLEFVYSGSSQLPITFACTLNTRPIEVRICQAFEADVPIAVGHAWSFGNNTVSISGLFKLSSSGASALTSGTKYRLIVRVHP